jgi:penicillin-binding protein 1A
VGVDYVIDYSRRLGIQSHLERDLSLAIGSSSVTLLEITSAYAVFPNGGRRVVPRFITRVTDRHGTILLDDLPLGPAPPPTTEPVPTPEERKVDVAASGARNDGYPDVEEIPTDQIISEQVAYLMCDLLKAVVTEGTGRRLLELNRPLAGKTGTTNDFADAWFLGFSPDVTTGVWVGHDQAAKRLGWGESGAKAALPIWKEYMRAALAERPVRDFDAPDNIDFLRIDRKTGLLADDNTQDAYFQPFAEGNVPTKTSGDASQSSDLQRAMRDDPF